MGLSASMYSGISGMQAQSQKMSVIGNNLANMNTNGFKSQSMQFEDFFYQDISTSAGTGQVGMGTGIASLYSNFTQGSFTTTGSSTDLAISGNGFFVVKDKDSGSTYYTRAGGYTFNSSGYMVDSNGLVLQGWGMQKNTSTGKYEATGSTGNIQLTNLSAPPNATTTVSDILNLKNTDTSKSDSATDPYAALFGKWDGTANPPLASGSYTYSSTLKVYDEAGTAHNLTVYMDPVDSNAGSTSGNKVWEYIVTCDPSEDGRTIGGTAFQGTSAAGLLMSGTMTFDSSGQLIDQSAFTLKSTTADSTHADGYKTMSDWTLADYSANGYPEFTANFTGSTTASFSDEANALNVDLNMGMKNSANTWSDPSAYGNLGALGTNSYSTLPGVGTNGQLQAKSTTCYDDSSSVLFQSQDGYSSGLLQSVSVDENGVITGKYSNGQTMDLFTITMADFTNTYGLRREGSNLFSETKDSGSALISGANTGTKGTIAASSLEESNVDMSEQFVEMITTQRGFQANSKIITTVDTMLNDVINLKR